MLNMTTELNIELVQARKEIERLNALVLQLQNALRARA
jgi:hypothetical protein|tara:strand:- start:141 stop:254 length:114 start_codon:yes stop_codon:yes gene_type:complete